MSSERAHSDTTAGPAADSAELEALKDLVVRHRIVWEVRPEVQIVRTGQRVQTGYILELSGVLDDPEENPWAGDDHCRVVYGELRRVADAILPQEPIDTRFEVEIFDPALHYSPQRHMREEVSLAIHILHRQGWQAPVDASEVRCLREMESALAELGARKGRWSANGTS